MNDQPDRPHEPYTRQPADPYQGQYGQPYAQDPGRQEQPYDAYGRPHDLPDGPHEQYAQQGQYGQYEQHEQRDQYGQHGQYGQRDQYGQPYAQDGQPYEGAGAPPQGGPHVPYLQGEVLHSAPAAPPQQAPRAAPEPLPEQQDTPRGPGWQPRTATGYGTVGQPLPPETAAAPEAAAEPAYGPATTVGNARITDAQRARAEGRSPVIEPGIRPAALTALLGLLLAGAAAVHTYALLVPLVLLQAVTAAGWFRLNGMWPARQGIALAFAGGLVADAAVLAAGRAHGSAAVLGTLGVWLLLALAAQLRSHAAPDERLYGLTASVASAALAVVAAGLLASGTTAVTVGAIAVAAAVPVRALPLPTAASALLALAFGAGGGALGGTLTSFTTADGALLGLGAAVCALVGHRAASYDYPSRFVHMTAGVALPLTAAAPAVWLLGRLLG